MVPIFSGFEEDEQNSKIQVIYKLSKLKKSIYIIIKSTNTHISFAHTMELFGNMLIEIILLGVKFLETCGPSSIINAQMTSTEFTLRTS